MKIKQNKISVVNWVFCQSFSVRIFLKIQQCLSVDDSEGKKSLHGVWTAWFIVKWLTVADFLYARSNVCHNRAKLTRLFCHCFVNLQFPQKTNCAYKYGYVYGVQLQCRLYWFQIHLFNFTASGLIVMPSTLQQRVGAQCTICNSLGNQHHTRSHYTK